MISHNNVVPTREDDTMGKGSCSIEGCGKPRYYSKEWCIMHLRRWERNGDPTARKVYRGDPKASLKANVKREGECLIWTGFLTHDGYGRLKVKGRNVPVHRAAWEQVHGPLPEGKVIDHACHNRACVNVSHLRPASLSQNMWNREKGQSSTGHRNVYRTTKGAYYVQIRHFGKKISFGTYSNLDDAAEAARRGREELFGDFAGNG